MDVVTRSADAAEAEIDRFISRRASEDKTPTADDLDPGYLESVRRHNAKIRRANRAAWYGWHMDQAERHRRNLTALIAHHEAAAAKLCEPGGEHRPPPPGR